ncbi:NADP-specific glutamate dehydrogenase [Glaciecola sp. 33A]|uniref:NADP-specific glutamate dehydrogenase n=1 Tax=Glaciecola sp. 33A TaxID=2057807 RepID=UPI000C34E685|nr:NADP-specific glutamate dehydrogenase [Glaciecola sp. 33A]PKI02991.1 NADP-specific glutamate dehydrogenase [Glaciecola sp. 33A]
MKNTCTDIDQFMAGLRKRNPGQEEFHEAVQEVAADVLPFIANHKDYQGECLLERLTEPDRIISFRVSWVDDEGNVRANRAWRVQFCNAIGPYKGGMRFDATVTESVLKFLGFEQIFKNSLTGLPMGGAKGGSNFNPKGKSDGEVMRFCQSLMTELHRYIGPDKDVPAGDIGVGAREIGYMFGQYRRLSHTFTGAMTGKGISFGGSVGRKEATGYGVVYFMREILCAVDDGIKGKTAVVSGSGNVALYCIEKLVQLGAKPLTASDSSGFIHDPDGIDEEKLAFLKDLKEVRRGRIEEYAEKFGCTFTEGRPWGVKADLAFPCATQNEMNGDEAKSLIDNGLIALAEGANMPCESEAQHLLRKHVLYAPGKASNAGGVAVSGLEQSQNSQRISWSLEEVDKRLQGIMKDIHDKCIKHGEGKGAGDKTDYVRGANIGGFIKVADALQECGVL